MFQGGQWILAMAVLHEMMLIRLPPSNATFSAAISACTSEQTLMVWDAKLETPSLPVTSMMCKHVYIQLHPCQASSILTWTPMDVCQTLQKPRKPSRWKSLSLAGSVGSFTTSAWIIEAEKLNCVCVCVNLEIMSFFLLVPLPGLYLQFAELFFCGNWQ